ncbi:EAL domain-containing protein [Marinicellulosiphila megalodicopiae]|uniref:EAL domain-containing protein n=1 Tax=Marinicellulosiphila megalodicopiae TaxID=2724896 RepID=UPI003BAF4ABB
MKNGLKLSTQLYALSGFIVIYAFVTSIINHSHTMKDYLDLPITLKTENTSNMLSELITTDLGNQNYSAIMDILDTFVSTHPLSLLTLKDNTDQLIFEYAPANNLTDSGIFRFFRIDTPIYNLIIKVDNLSYALQVQIHSTEFNTTLWQYFTRTLATTLLLALIVLIVIWRLIQTITDSLSALEKQAIGISKKQYNQNNIPGFTLEFKTLGHAFNQMSKNIKRSFEEHTQSNEKLIKQAFVDSLTNLPNRRAAQNFFEQHQQSKNTDNDALWIFLISLPSLKDINDNQGYGDGDLYVQDVANSIKNTLIEMTDFRLFRLSGSEFLLSLSNQTIDHHLITIQLTTLFTAKTKKMHKDGFASFITLEVLPDMTFSNVLCHADNSLNQKLILQSHENAKHEFISSSKTKTQWQGILKNYEQSAEILDLNRSNSKIFTYSISEFLHRTHVLTAFINLSIQPIYSKEHTVLYNESFVRFIDSGQPLNTSEVFAAAERLNIAQTLERTIITYTLRNLLNQNRDNNQEIEYGINISNSAIADSNFTEWLINFLLHLKNGLPNLVFEINESCVLNTPKQSKKFINAIKQLHYKITIDRFGSSFVSFKYIKDLDIDYVKLDGSFIQDIQSNDTQFFVQSTTDICHGIGINVIASHIESNEIYEICTNLFIDGFQGYSLSSEIASPDEE